MNSPMLLSLEKEDVQAFIIEFKVSTHVLLLYNCTYYHSRMGTLLTLFSATSTLMFQNLFRLDSDRTYTIVKMTTL